MSIIKEKYLVTKRNVLNEIRANSMTLQELRFFSIYLSKINPNDISTRVVRFPIDDFKAIMELGRINIDYMKTVTNRLLSKIVNVPTERGGYIGFQLFKRCKVDIDDFNEWYVEIDANDDALPLMFEFKDKYFSYQLWNALKLKSVNQLRMYEILKQYEKIGIRILSVEELRNLLGIEKNEYERFNNLKQWVLEPCQNALQENTDIKFTYEPYGKKGPGGKILFIKFTIQKNKTYNDKLTLDKFIVQHNDNDEVPLNRYEERVLFLSDACNNEFTKNEMVVISNLLSEKMPQIFNNDLQCFDYILRKYNELNLQEERKKRTNNKIEYRFNYFKSLIGTE